MKKTLIAISILSIFGGVLYFYTSDESVKKNNIVKVDVKPIEKVEKIQFEKTKENGFNEDGKCVKAGSPCMMELVREAKLNINKKIESLKKKSYTNKEKEHERRLYLKEKERKESLKNDRDYLFELNNQGVYATKDEMHLNLNENNHYNIKKIKHHLRFSHHIGFERNGLNVFYFKTAKPSDIDSYMIKNKPKSLKLPYVDEYSNLRYFTVACENKRCKDKNDKDIQIRMGYYKNKNDEPEMNLYYNSYNNMRQTMFIDEDGNGFVLNNRDKNGNFLPVIIM